MPQEFCVVRKDNKFKKHFLTLAFLAVGLFSLLARPTSASANFSLVQSATSSGRLSVPPFNLSLNQPVAADDALVVMTSVYNGTTSPVSVTDSLGNTFRLVAAPKSKSGNTYLQIYLATGTPGGSDTISVGNLYSYPQESIAVEELSGVNSLDVGDYADNAPVPSTINLTTAATDMFFAVAAQNSATPYSAAQTLDGEAADGGISSTSAPYLATWTWTNDGDGYAAGAHTNDFTPGGAGATSTTYALLALAAPPARTPTVPVIATSSPTGLEPTYATLNAGIVDDGGAPTSEEGFNWGTTTAYGNVASTSQSFGVGAFSKTLTGLVPGTTYHYQVYAVNAVGAATSSDQTFTAPLTTGIEYAFDAYGLQKLTYNGISYITNPPVHNTGTAHAIFQTATGTVSYVPVGSTASIATSSDPDTIEQTYNAGKADSFTVKWVFSTTSADTLKTDIYVTNNDATDTLAQFGGNYFLTLAPPGTTPNNDYWGQIGSGIGLGPVSVGTNYYSAGPVTFLSGGWGSFALFSDDYAGSWTLGSPNSGSSTTAPTFNLGFANYGSNGGDAANTLYDPITPGQTAHYDYYLRFGTATDTAATLAPDGFAAWRAEYPNLTAGWPRNAPIARWFLADGNHDSATNPRGYLSSSTLDASDQTAFDAAIMATATSTIAKMNAMNPKPQGILIWDLEGEELSQPFTYVGNPNELATISPEMNGVADQLISTIQNAGYQVGLTLRPSNFGAGPTLPATCHYDSNQYHQDSDVFILTTATFPYRGYECTAPDTWTQPGAYEPAHQTGSELDSVILSNLESKVSYAENRWGIHLFYVDSTVYGDADTGVSYRIFRQLETDFPDCLFFIEELGGNVSYGASAGYSAPGDRLTTPQPAQAASDIYPDAFNVYQPVDSGSVDLTTGSTDYDNLVQAVKNGNILLYDGWESPAPGSDSAQVAGIYQAAGFSDATNTAVAPSVSASAPNGVTDSSITLNASIVDDGGASSTVRGFYYGTTTGYGLSASSTGTFGVGAFSETLSGLTCNTTYHYRAFATNAAGTGTSSDQTFSTSSCPPMPDATPPSISITSPSDGAMLSDTVTLAASATDDVAVASVHFLYGATPIGSPVTATTTPDTYQISWDTTGAANGSYVLYAVAEDSSGNFATSSVSITVDNAVTPPPSGGGGGGSISSGSSVSHPALAALLTPSASTTAYLNTIARSLLPSCPVGWTCVPIVPAATSSVATPSITFTHDLYLGLTNADVLRLQQYLNAHGYFVAATGNGSPGHETNYFGLLTKTALAKFQKAHGIPATGYFGPITRGFLNS